MPLSQLLEVSLLKLNVLSVLQARSAQHSQSVNTTVQQETTALVDTKTYQELFLALPATTVLLEAMQSKIVYLELIRTILDRLLAKRVQLDRIALTQE
jgi:hypothetical protein